MSISAIATGSSGRCAPSVRLTMPPSDAPTNAPRSMPNASRSGGRVAVAGKIGREHVVRRRERRTELLPHVRGLAAAVQADDRASGARPPFEVMDLAAVDEREAAASAGGDVVTGREKVELGVGCRHAPLPCPSNHAALSR